MRQYRNCGLIESVRQTESHDRKLEERFPDGLLFNIGAASGQIKRYGLGILLLVFLLAAPGASGLTVLYTSSLNGNLDGCTCPNHPRAGLAIRAAWLQALPGRRQALLVDAGNILAGSGKRALSREILETYAELGYDAVAVGGREIADGTDSLTEYRDRFGLICQNLTLCTASHCLLFTPQPLLLEKDDAQVGVFALLDPKALAVYPKESTRDAKLIPPDVLAGSMVRQLADQGAEWIIMLYHGPLKDAEALARSTPGIHVIIVGSEQRLIRPRKIGDALLVSPGEEGNRVGILELSRDGRGRVRHSHRFQLFEYGTDPADPAVLKRIERLRS